MDRHPFTAQTCRPLTKDAGLLTRVALYWDSLRGHGRRLPQRREVDPGALGEALPLAFFVECLPGGEPRVRVAGHGVNALAGRDLRGTLFVQLFAPEARAEIADQVAQLFQQPAALTLSLTVEGGALARLLLLPMIGRDGLVSTALGVIDVAGDASGLLRPEAPGELTAIGLRARAAPGPDPVMIVVEGAAGPLPPLETDRGAAMPRPALKLVVDNT